MKFSIKSGNPEKQRSACLVVGIFEPRKLTEPAKAMDTLTEGYISNLLRNGDMEGKAGTTLMLHKRARHPDASEYCWWDSARKKNSAKRSIEMRSGPLSRH